jgi:glycosyltransferase involved in cell wall biosynthesis
VTGAGLHVVVPGPIEQRTGGYIYDAQIVAGLRQLDWRVVVHNLAGTFPDVDMQATRSMTLALAAIPTGSRVLIDGLAMGGLPGPVRAESRRLRVLALVHHPLSDEIGLDTSSRARFAALEREALAACAGVVVTSEFTARRLSAFGVAPVRVRVVRPGTKRAPVAVGPGGEAAPALLCVATVARRKGQDVLIRALASLRDLPWTCVCAGSLDRDPGYARAVEEQLCATGLGARIRLVGECEPDQVDDLYHHASLFVLPSYYEGYGMVLTDALARGLPVVSTTGGAIPHTLPPEACRLVPPGDHQALADALRPLLSDGGSERRAVLATAARRHADGLPDWREAAATFASATLELTTDGDV